MNSSYYAYICNRWFLLHTAKPSDERIVRGSLLENSLLAARNFENSAFRAANRLNGCEHARISIE